MLISYSCIKQEKISFFFMKFVYLQIICVGVFHFNMRIFGSRLNGKFFENLILKALMVLGFDGFCD